MYHDLNCNILEIRQTKFLCSAFFPKFKFVFSICMAYSGSAIICALLKQLNSIRKINNSTKAIILDNHELTTTITFIK